MQLYIYRNNERTGPFAEESVLAQLRSGALSPDDLGIPQREANWRRPGDISAGGVAAAIIGIFLQRVRRA